MIPSKKHLSILLGFLVTLTFLTYYHRNPTGDDAWFAEQAYWLQKIGIIRSNFFSGLLGWDNQILVSHKLFLLVGASFIKLFGYQLPVVQFVGFLSFCIFIGEVVFYLYRKEKAIYSWYLLALLILIFSNRLLIKMSFENRPEIMLAALGFGSFLVLQNEKPSLWKAMWAGLLAGLALLVHLNGVIYLLAGLGSLLYLRHYKPAITFAFAGGLTGLLYFMDVFLATDGFNVWYHQFRHDPATQNAFGLYSKLVVMLTYPRLFFYSPEEIALSLLLVFLLWSQRSVIKAVPLGLKVYSFFLFFSFWLITKKNSGLYCVLFMPFMFALVYELYRSRPFITVGLKIVLSLYFIIGLYGTIEIIIKNFTTEYLPVSYKNLRKSIPTAKTGLVPLTFFFNEYEQYPFLLGYDTYKHTMKDSVSSSDGMAKWANQNGVGFILMDYKLSKEDWYPRAGTARLPFYQLHFFDGRFAVYAHQ
ncbi:hypothetical protein GCM10028803_17900 [Larkinella knui]|uniref:Glycosyltransferase RgtA/B/C/D-like domain-containing protein n=1 Tax=Larkinella knui TaxID=2025310 RepID=A0A3P1CUX6_9BACT|nr:hypothetical protein [Larkinella knui]RRB16900.1 hypothetical protein EHT87_01000 [Larkinella knui]